MMLIGHRTRSWCGPAASGVPLRSRDAMFPATDVREGPVCGRFRSGSCMPQPAMSCRSSHTLRSLQSGRSQTAVRGVASTEIRRACSAHAGPAERHHYAIDLPRDWIARKRSSRLRHSASSPPACARLQNTDGFSHIANSSPIGCSQ